MANFAKGLAAGFESGYKLGEMYRAGKTRREIEEAQKAQPKGGFTTAEGERLVAASEEKDQYGNPLYKITVAPDSTWQNPKYVKQRLSYQEAEPTRGLSAEEEQYLRNVERAVNRDTGLPYYSVNRGDDGIATVRARSVYQGGAFEPYRGYEDELRRLEKVFPEGNYPESLRPRIEAEKAAAQQARDELIKQYESTARFGVGGRTGERIAVPIGPEEVVAPSSLDYLGKTYRAGIDYYGGLSPAQQNAALLDRTAQILSQNDPIEGMKFRIMAEQERRAAELFPKQLAQAEQGLTKGGLDIEVAQDAKKQREALRKVDAEYKTWYEKRVGDRTPTSEDTIAGLQWRATRLFEVGLGDEATKVMQQHMVMANQRIELQARERAAEIPRVLSALAAGDTDAAEAFYRKYVPDGANVKDIKREKDGSFTIIRETLTGEKLPPTRLQNLGEISAVINMFNDPMELVKFTQRQIENNYRDRALDIQQKTLDENRAYRGQMVGLRVRELDRPTAGNIVTIVDKDGNKKLFNIATGKEVTLPSGYEPAKIDTSINAEDKLKLQNLYKSDDWKRARTRADQIKAARKYNIDPADLGLGAGAEEDWDTGGIQ